jgi:hypothetical protein
MEENNLLLMELSERYTFARHHLQLYISWYTFFLTVNFLSIGWFTSVLLTGTLKVSLPIILITIFFVVQLALSYAASAAVRSYFARTNNRCNELLSLLGQSPQSHLQPKTAMPVQVYVTIINLMCYTLVSFIIFWISLSIITIYLVPL